VFDPDSPVTVDGVPNDATSLDDIATDSLDFAFGEVGQDAKEAISSVDNAVSELDGEEALSEIESVVESNTDTDINMSGSVDGAAQAAKEFIRLSDAGQTENVSEFVYGVTSSTRGSAGAYSRLDNQLVVNPEVVESDEYQEWFNEGKIGGDSVEWAVRHEVGHARHAETMSLDESRSLRRASLDEQEQEAIQENLSLYAAHSPTEFVAEAYAAQVSGRELRGFLPSNYEAFSGPEVPN